MSWSSTSVTIRSPNAPLVPWLESGDRLTRSEFERRYEAMPSSVKAELIGGVVYVASPTRAWHGEPHANLIAWLVNYRAETPHTQALDDTSARLSEEDEPKPDATLRIVAKGASQEDEDGFITGAPEWIGEIALSSAAYDLHQKLEAYQRAGCEEYVVVVLHSREIRWFRLEEGRFVDHPADEDGVFRSRVFPGLWLDGAAFLRGDVAQVLAVLRAGLATSEHAAFVEDLRARAEEE